MKVRGARIVRTVPLCLIAVLLMGSGAYGELLAPAFDIPNPGANNLKNFGYSIVDGADLDGDGATDFIMCGYYEGNAGQNKQGDCRAFSGQDLGEILDFGSPTPQSYNVNAGFLNIDGLHGIDVIMGGDLKDNGRTPGVGEAYVFFLGPDHKGNFDVIGYQTVESPVQAAEAQFAKSLAVFDSEPVKVVFGAPGLGKAFVYEINAGQLSGPIQTIDGGGDEFGYAMAAVDGHLVVGAPGSNKVNIYLNEPNGFSFVDYLAGEWAGFGRTVTALGDVDSSGTEDFAVGTNDGMASDPGWITPYDIQTLDALLSDPISGNRVASVGTWDCDEYSDIAVGSSSFNAAMRAETAGGPSSRRVPDARLRTSTSSSAKAMMRPGIASLAAGPILRRAFVARCWTSASSSFRASIRAGTALVAGWRR